MQNTDEEILALYRQLGPNGQTVLKAIAERLVLGHKNYGDFPIRDWTKEAAEEALDQTVYLTAGLIFAAAPQTNR